MMARNLIAISLLMVLAQFSTVALAQTQETADDRQCRHPLLEPVQDMIQMQFDARSINVEASLLVDLRDTIVEATCDASKRAIERIESGNIPDGGIASVDRLPSTLNIATSLAERVSLGIVEDGHSSRIEALALSMTFGVNAMLRDDSRKVGFVEVECPGTGDNEGFRISDDNATCDRGLATYVGAPTVILYSSGKDICAGETSVKRGKTVTCRCDIASDKSRLMCR